MVPPEHSLEDTSAREVNSTQGKPARIAPRERLIIALDFPNAESALALVDRLDGRCKWFKVGLELYLSAGNSIVETLKKRGFAVFLDLKLHDIPNTVGGAVRSVTDLGADFLSVHAAGGPAMLLAAAETVSVLPSAPRLLAVTVLTSMDAAQLAAVGIAASLSEQALRLAKIAHNAGIRGFVSSPQEAAHLRQTLPDSVLVTPGIRPAGVDSGDQKRIATPATALSAGADYLVVGRPVTQAKDPVLAAEAVLKEISVN